MLTQEKRKGTSPNPVCRAYVIRGGSSRGVIARYSDLPQDRPIDAVALSLLSAASVPVDGLGGGGPTTSKFVAIGEIRTTAQKVEIEYRVANLSPGSEIVDWAGTCGNMTSAVPLFALAEGIYHEDDTRALELINLSTGGRVQIEGLKRQADGSFAMTTRYLSPEGAVLGQLLPTGSARDHSRIEGKDLAWSLLDVTHPYLFAARKDLVAHDGPLTPDDLDRIEALRGEVAMRIGVVSAAADAARLSGAVPRVILVSEGKAAGEVIVTAISMGKEIASVPVTSALCIAAAAGVQGSVVAEVVTSHMPEAPVTVRSGSFTVMATATFDATGRLLAASVPRTARVLMRGEAYLP